MTFDVQWGGLYRVISGGQTGADQGGLIAAWKANVDVGGQAPAHYKTSIGYNPMLQVLGLTAAGDFASRTAANVKNSEGTVIIGVDLGSTGSRCTRTACRKFDKPVLDLSITSIVSRSQVGPEAGTDRVMDLILDASTKLKEFVVQNRIGTLNIAGNRELISAGQYGVLVITNVSNWIVSTTLEMLDLDGKLIRKS